VKVDVLGAAVVTAKGLRSSSSTLGRSLSKSWKSFLFPRRTARPGLDRSGQFWIFWHHRQAALYLAEVTYTTSSLLGLGDCLQTLIINLLLMPCASSDESALKMPRRSPRNRKRSRPSTRSTACAIRAGGDESGDAALFKREGVNPCRLPALLIQMPFLYAYYSMLGA